MSRNRPTPDQTKGCLRGTLGTSFPTLQPQITTKTQLNFTFKTALPPLPNSKGPAAPGTYAGRLTGARTPTMNAILGKYVSRTFSGMPTDNTPIYQNPEFNEKELDDRENAIDEIKIDFEPPEIFKDITIVSLNPMGKPAKVETATYIPPPTPRVIPKPVPKSDIKFTIMNDPANEIMFTLNREEDFEHKGQEFRNIRDTLLTATKPKTMELIPMPTIYGPVDFATFNRCLDIYEYNQNCMISILESIVVNEQVFIDSINNIEAWFMMIIEPIDRSNVAGWKVRELNKLRQHHSDYCDKSLRKYIRSMGSNVRNTILIYHSVIKIENY